MARTRARSRAAGEGADPQGQLLQLLASTETATDWGPWLRRILAGVAAIARCDRAACLYVNASGELRVDATWNLDDDPGLAAVLALDFRATPTLIAEAWATGRVVSAENVEPGRVTAFVPARSYPFAMALPIEVDDVRVGVLSLGWLRPGERPDRRRIDALRLAARYLGAARRRYELAAERERALIEAHRASRLYRALSQCNQAVVRARDRDELLERACAAAAEYAGLSVAFIGWLDDARQRFEIRHHAGGPPSFIASARRRLAKAVPGGGGLTGRALRLSRVVVSPDLAREEGELPLRRAALAHGMRSMAVAPLNDGGRVGALVLISPQVDFFGPADVALLTELAADIGFGLRALAVQDRVAEHEAVLEACFDDAEEGLLVVDDWGRIEAVNRPLARMVGRERAALVGEELAVLMTDADRADVPGRVAGILARARRRIEVRREVVVRRADGSTFPARLHVLEVRTPHARKFVGKVVDLSERKALEARLEHLARHDAATGLYNLVGLREHFQRLAASGVRRVGVAVMDLDDFRTVNDAFGQRTVDRVLVAFARRLVRHLPRDGVAARVGGDEFAVVGPLGLDESLEAWAARLLTATDVDFRVGGRTWHQGLSLGAAAMPDAGSDIDLLLWRAQVAMSDVKRAGGHGLALYSPSLEERHQRLREAPRSVRQAIERHELVLHYQPQVDMLDGRIVGFEALVRWQDPERGLRMPGEFLPFITDERVMRALGRWGTAEALGEWRRWRERGLDAKVAVNAAPEWFLSEPFLSDLREALDAVGAASGALEIEITETAALQDMERARAVIDACHALGVTVCLDDFGTGYAAISHLKELPVDAIKIDIAFTRALLDSGDAWTIVQAIVLMGIASGRQVVAEGVETTAHEEALLRTGVRLGQGYSFARPLPASDVDAWIDAWRARIAGAGGRRGGDRAERGAEFLKAVYLHMRWVQRLAVGALFPQAAGAAELLDRERCPLDRWAQRFGAGRAEVAELARLHFAGHVEAEHLFDPAPTAAAARARVEAFVEAQVRFVEAAWATYFPGRGPARAGG